MFSNLTKALTRALVLVTIVSVSLPWTVLADNVRNDVQQSGSENRDYVIGGAPVQVGYFIQATGGSCDAADGTAATVTVNVPDPRILVKDSAGVEDSTMEF